MLQVYPVSSLQRESHFLQTSLETTIFRSQLSWLHGFIGNRFAMAAETLQSNKHLSPRVPCTTWIPLSRVPHTQQPEICLFVPSSPSQPNTLSPPWNFAPTILAVVCKEFRRLGASAFYDHHRGNSMIPLAHADKEAHHRHPPGASVGLRPAPKKLKDFQTLSF